VAVIDAVLVLSPQAWHPLHQALRVPDLDLLTTQTHLHLLPDEPRGHRIGVVPHLDGAALVHPHPQALLALQPPRRQGAEERDLGGQGRLAPAVPLCHEGVQEDLILLAAGKVPAAPQQQGLGHGFLEAPMTLLAIAVLVAAGGIGRLGHEPVVRQQRLIPRRELLGVPVRMHRQRQAIRAVPLRHAAQGPQGILQALTQAGETLGRADRHVFPVRVRQDEVVEQVIPGLPRDRDAEALHVREVRRRQAARLMHLGKIHFLGRAMLGLPDPHAPLQRAPHGIRIGTWVGALQPAQ
jgi:hypothetical protein